MVKLAELRFITAELCCPQNKTFTKMNFRVIIGKKNSRWINKVLIVSKGSFNPFEFITEVLLSVNEFLSDFNLKLKDCELLLDLTEYYGLYNPNLYKLAYKADGLNECNIEQADLDSLDKEWKKILEFYYDDRWSIFKESLLTTGEKAEIITNVLSNSLLDTISIENVKREIDSKFSRRKQDFLNQSYYQ